MPAFGTPVVVVPEVEVSVAGPGLGFCCGVCAGIVAGGQRLGLGSDGIGPVVDELLMVILLEQWWVCWVCKWEHCGWLVVLWL